MKIFTSHPASVGESYFQHMIVALRFSARLGFGAIAAFIHGFFPFLFMKTGSQIICKLHEELADTRGVNNGEN